MRLVQLCANVVNWRLGALTLGSFLGRKIVSPFGGAVLALFLPAALFRPFRDDPDGALAICIGTSSWTVVAGPFSIFDFANRVVGSFIAACSL
jgi:hypothetical protein